MTTVELPQLIGAPVVRKEDERFLRGEGCYIDDVKYLDMCHAVVVRSTVAHGRVLSIDTEAALSVDGVLGVFTADDFGPDLPLIPVRVGVVDGLQHCLQPPLARDRVRYVGEPLAVVVATDRYIAEDAAELVYADIESMDVVVDPRRARGAISLHDACPDNCPVSYEACRGDVNAAFAQADYTRKASFYMHRHSSVPMETRGLVAHWDDEGRLDLWGATKVPFFNRDLLSRMLQVPKENIDLHEVDVGGSFGARGEFYPEDYLIPFVARRVARAVKWIEDRRENFLSMNHSRDMYCELEIAASKDGRILGLRAHLLADTGAYARTTGAIPIAKAGLFVPGPYDIQNYAYSADIVVTNKVPCGTFRGPGRYEANFFRERIIDMMAADLGLDPAEVRLMNLVRPEQMPYSVGKLVPYEGPSEYDGGDYPAALRRAMQEIDYAGLKAMQGQLIDGKYHGVGIGCFVDSSGAGPAETARIKIVSPDHIELYTGCSSSGQGHETTFAQVLADILHVDPAVIDVFHGSTTYVPHGYGTYHGRGIVMGGSAIKLAAEAMITAWKEAVATRHGKTLEQLSYHDGEVLSDDGTKMLSIRSLNEFGDETLLEAMATFKQTVCTFEYGTQIAHVAVDPDTAVVEVKALVTVEDCGRVINPMIVHGQVIGASVQGLSGALLEEFVYDGNGQMTSGTFADYMLATSTDFPEIRAISIDMAPSTLNPLGVKGVGEGGIEGVGAAVANAISNALATHGVNITRLPVTPNALHAQIYGYQESTQ